MLATLAMNPIPIFKPKKSPPALLPYVYSLRQLRLPSATARLRKRARARRLGALTRAPTSQPRSWCDVRSWPPPVVLPLRGPRTLLKHILHVALAYALVSPCLRSHSFVSALLEPLRSCPPRARRHSAPTLRPPQCSSASGPMLAPCLLPSRPGIGAIGPSRTPRMSAATRITLSILATLRSERRL